MPTDVYCQMAEDSIPVSLCYEEQGTNACRLCSAASRRCAACGQANGIAEPKDGLCPKCMKSEDRKARRAGDVGDPTVVDIGDSLESLSEDLETIGQGDVASLEIMYEDLRGDEDIPANLVRSAAVENTDALFAVLCEHVVVRQGVRVITSPGAVLMQRARLLPHEVEIVLNTLVDQGKIAWSDDRRDIAMLTTEEVPHAVHSTQQNGRGVADGRSDRKVLKIATRPTEAQRIPTIGEVYGELLGRYREVGGERVVGGAIPFLQLRFKLSPQLVEQILEKLEQERLVERRDEWRTLSLLSDAVDDTRPAVGEKVLSRLKQRTARARIRLKKGVRVQHVLKTALASLDEVISQLREVRDRVDSQLEPLEHVRDELRLAHRELVDSKESSKQTLELVDKAAEALERAET